MLWGLHMGSSQGLLAALITDTTPVRVRGTAFGIFNLAGGAAMLVASLLAGWLWSCHGAPASFYARVVFMVVASGAWRYDPGACRAWFRKACEGRPSNMPRGARGRGRRQEGFTTINS
jgi:MFS family permease